MKTLMEIFYGAAFVAASAYFAFKGSDPRFNGFRLGSKGGAVFFIGWLVIAVVDDFWKLNVIRSFGFVIAVVGFAIMIIGFVKHAKIVLYPGEFDARREIDPGYDIPYQLCPSCKQIEIRMYHKKMKCPQCGAAIKTVES